MKKLVAMCLIMCFILFSCQNSNNYSTDKISTVTRINNEINTETQLSSGASTGTPAKNANEDHQFSKITVIKNPDDVLLSSLYTAFGRQYDSYQAALDDLVEQYNTLYDNSVLLKICTSISYSDYIANSKQIQIEYYSQFFIEIWEDKNFNKATIQDQENIAEQLITDMYTGGMQSQSIDFYNKYISNVQDNNTLIYFGAFYSNLYVKDPHPDNNNIKTMFEITKNIENKYYGQLTDGNKLVLFKTIANYAKLFNDQNTENEYNQKAVDLMKNINSN